MPSLKRGRLLAATVCALSLGASNAVAMPVHPGHTPEPPPPVSPVLRAIAECESGGDPTAVSADGTYRGKYQFSRETWAAMGGTGDPAAAPEYVQDRLAAKLYRVSGPGQWPVCAG